MQAFLSLTSGFNSARWLDAIPGSSFTWLIVPIMLNLLRVEKMTSSTARGSPLRDGMIRGG
jgi:hypothetical protein